VTADEIRVLQQAFTHEEVNFVLYEIALQLAENTRLEIEVDRLQDELRYLRSEDE